MPEWTTSYTKNPAFESQDENELLKYVFEGVHVERINKRKFLFYARPVKFQDGEHVHVKPTKELYDLVKSKIESILEPEQIDDFREHYIEADLEIQTDGVLLEHGKPCDYFAYEKEKEYEVVHKEPFIDDYDYSGVETDPAMIKDDL